jgi:aldose 1-epimerase
VITTRSSGHVTREFFGALDADNRVEAITLSNNSGAQVQVLTYGATIRSVRVPDRGGILDDVVLGYDTLQEYRDDVYYIGGVIGRFANRIANGRFELDGRPRILAVNDGPNHLHGGRTGFHTRLWRAEPFPSQAGVAVRLSRVSPHGEEGYPGTLHVAVVYTWTPANELIVDYRATTDQPTPINVTQHAYFNLRGGCRGGVLDHELQIFANEYLSVDETLIPQSRETVAGTPFDFRSARTIRSIYDHCFVLRDLSSELSRAACLFEPHSGRTLDVLTTEPGLQLYTGQFLSGGRGKNGCAYGSHAGLCLETQHFPDSPNRPDFPGVILRPGERFRSTTIFRFGTRSTAT